MFLSWLISRPYSWRWEGTNVDIVVFFVLLSVGWSGFTTLCVFFDLPRKGEYKEKKMSKSEVALFGVGSFGHGCSLPEPFGIAWFILGERRFICKLWFATG